MAKKQEQQREEDHKDERAESLKRELRAMGRIAKEMDGLKRPEQLNLVAWLNQRYGLTPSEPGGELPLGYGAVNVAA